MIDAITDGNRVGSLIHLLEFLAKWEERPARLTPMAYQWCSTIFEVAGGLGRGSMRIDEGPRRRDMEFVLADPGCDLFHSDDLGHGQWVALLLTTLEVGFRLADTSCGRPVLDLDHTSHHDQMFKAVFSCDNDEIIADAVGAWIIGKSTPTGSCAHYFAKRVARATPFSSRLRQVGIRALERNWRSELTMSISETVCLLNCLEVDVDDVGNGYEWRRLLVEIIRSTAGFESLSSHCWCLLGRLASKTMPFDRFGPRDEDVMKSLEKVEDWEKLEAWMAITWGFPADSFMPESMENIKRVTLKLASDRPSALQRFENLGKSELFSKSGAGTVLQPMLDRARAERQPLESSPPP